MSYCIAVATFSLLVLVLAATGIRFSGLATFLGLSASHWTASATGIALAVSAFAANVMIVSRLKRRTQIAVVWLELLLLLLIFFYSFNLSIGFIVEKLGILIFTGAVSTILISALSIALASLFAFLGAIAKLSQNGMILGLSSFYTSLFRGTPLLMQIYLIYLGLPQLGYVVGAVPAGIAALSLCYGAYMTEIFRSGIESISKGQWEAARSLGLSPWKILSKVIIPQALPVIIPPVGNQYISMLKDSSLISVIGVWELLYLSRTLGSRTFQHLEMLITAAMIYWIISIALELIQSRIEDRFRSADRKS